MSQAGEVVRYAVWVQGLVQGVGFRPFVWQLASEFKLTGWVRNDGAGVTIEVQGERGDVEFFLDGLRVNAPPLARIEHVTTSALPTAADLDFTIAKSGCDSPHTEMPLDTGTCGRCIAELCDPNDRRYRYGLISCTECGPRFTVTEALPFDRERTSMRAFRQCNDCSREYVNPDDRRFRSELISCAHCGPVLALRDNALKPIEGDVISAALQRIQSGQILAIKGIGGFHLVCNARDREAVAALRARKKREEKPFAVMVNGLESLCALAEVSAAERVLIQSRERPIVLLRKRWRCDPELFGVAPGMAWLGVMLPYAPIHYLLFHEAAGRPAGTAWLLSNQPLVLVMTSANTSGDPVISEDADAFARLRTIADAYVTHNRDIIARCDDSVVSIAKTDVSFIRRARGYAPASIRLRAAGPPLLAVGGSQKSTICVTRDDKAFLSQHIGDLDNLNSCRAFDSTMSYMLRMVGVEPKAVACDMHPDSYCYQHAMTFSLARGIQCVPVQHHHAHIAAVAAEHNLSLPVLGLALDGVGHGRDGGSWGGELLLVNEGSCTRLGHLRELPLPGGDRAAREPWRMAASALHLMGRGKEVEERVPEPNAILVNRMLLRGINSPLTSSAGRWFDAAAGLLRVRDTCSFEGQAAMLLQTRAEEYGPVEPLADGYFVADNVLDPLNLLERLADERDAARGAALFHATFARGLAEWILQASEQTGIRVVCLGGGCFVNRLLTSALRAHLEEQGISVMEARLAPPNDGGLAFGQAAVAAALLHS